jgi:hypothetical protein
MSTAKVVTNRTNGATTHKVKSSSVNDFYYPPIVSGETAYEVLNQYHSKPAKLRVACIGAGASGLCLAYKMERQMVPGSWDLTLFEKNPHFGGTWYSPRSQIVPVHHVSLDTRPTTTQ